MNRLTGIQATLAVFITLSLPAMAKSADTVDQWIAEALNNNASLGKQRASVEAAEVDRRPVFTASAGYNSLWADERKRWMVGVGVQIPLSGQRQNSAVRRAAAEVSQRQWQTTQAHRDLLGSIGEVKAAVVAGYDHLEILDARHLPNQRAHWEASLNELASGTGRLEDAINSARQLTGVKLSREAVIRDLFSARARYEALQPAQAISVSN